MSNYVPDPTAPPLAHCWDPYAEDPTLNGIDEPSLKTTFRVDPVTFNRVFFEPHNISYITDYFLRKNLDVRVVTHSNPTNTCYEKSIILGKWDPLNVVKALYFQDSEDEVLYTAVIPETGCFVDKEHLMHVLDIRGRGTFKKSRILPRNMDFGTCSPFVVPEDLLENGGPVKKIVFDTETLVSKKYENQLDDFSFGMDHRLSLQLNYYHCYKMLKNRYGSAIDEREILTLSFKEKFRRSKGRIEIQYEFKSLNYRTARFINDNHGFGDVSIVNDFVDELDLPDVLTSPNRISNKHKRERGAV